MTDDVERVARAIEDEFLANIMLPDGQTVGEWIRPQVAESYRTALMTPMLPMLPKPETTDA